MKIAALDLGSNTFLCLICEVENNQITNIYEDVIEFVRLAEGMQTIPAGQEKKITEEALVRAEKAFEKFKILIDQHKPEYILGMGTSATRDASNKDQLISLGQKYGIPIEAIPGSDEAQITNQGAFSDRDLSQLENRKFLVIDIGGGSTEFILSQIQNKICKIVFAKSYDIGCVRLKEKFKLDLPVNAELFLQAEEYLQNAMNDFKMTNIQGLTGLDEIIAVAGTPTTLAMAEQKTSEITKADGFKLTETHLKNWLIKTKPAKVQDLIDWGVPAGRADVILVGIMTLLNALKKFNQTTLTVSTRGVRHGVALLVYQRHA